jgi:transposase
VLRTGAELLTDKQKKQLTAVFADDAHVEVEATWLFYQRIVAAYRDPDRVAAKTSLTQIINELRAGVPKMLTELIALGRTLNRRADDVLAYVDRPGTSNGPTEAICDASNTYAAAALGFRNPPHYIARFLL